MGCCNKNSGCSKNIKYDDMPKEALFDSSTDLVAGVAVKLLDIAAAGLRANTVFRQFNFSNPKLDALGKQIADLAIENAYLKSITDMFSPTVFNTVAGDIEISFGPKNEYSLKIPLPTKCSRQNIIKQLRSAADKLELKDATPEDLQRFLPFLSE